MKSKDLVCDPLGREDLRKFAKAFKRKYGYGNSICFPIEDLFDQIAIDYGFEYEVLSDDEFKDNEFAVTELLENKIYFRESTFINACMGEGFGRMTMAHELYHILSSKLYGVKLYRKVSKNGSAYNDPEWQAKCFAGELLIDYEKTKNMNWIEIIVKCKVSDAAANYRINKIK